MAKPPLRIARARAMRKLAPRAGPGEYAAKSARRETFGMPEME
jgi:hypothetical protein